MKTTGKKLKKTFMVLLAFIMIFSALPMSMGLSLMADELFHDAYDNAYTQDYKQEYETAAAADTTTAAATPFGVGLIGFNAFNNGTCAQVPGIAGRTRIWMQLDGTNALAPYYDTVITATDENGNCALALININRIWNNTDYFNLIDVFKNLPWHRIYLTATLDGHTAQLLLINNLSVLGLEAENNGHDNDCPILAADGIARVWLTLNGIRHAAPHSAITAVDQDGNCAMTYLTIHLQAGTTYLSHIDVDKHNVWRTIELNVAAQGAQDATVMLINNRLFGWRIFNNGNNNNASLAAGGTIRMWTLLLDPTTLELNNALIPYAAATFTAIDQDGNCAMDFIRVNRIWNNLDYFNFVDANKHARWQYIDFTITVFGQTITTRLLNNQFFGLNIFNNGNNNNQSLANAGLIRMWTQLFNPTTMAMANHLIPYAAITAVSAYDQDGNCAMDFVRVNRIWNNLDYFNFVDANKHARWQYIDFTITVFGQTITTRLLNNQFFGLNIFNNGNNNNQSLANAGLIRMWTQLFNPTTMAMANHLIPYAAITAVSAYDQDGNCAMDFVNVNRIWNNLDYVNLIDVTKRAPWVYIDFSITVFGQTVDVRLYNNEFFHTRVYQEDWRETINIWFFQGLPFYTNHTYPHIDSMIVYVDGNSVSIRDFTVNIAPHQHYIRAVMIDKHLPWQNLVIYVTHFGQTIRHEFNNNMFVMPYITTTVLPAGQVDVAYTTTLQANASGTLTWSITAGTLPNGLTLGASNGIISGTPTTAGTFTFTARATDELGNYHQRQFTITIAPVAATSVEVTVAGDASTVLQGNSLQFSSNVTPTTANQAVTWSVTGHADVSINADGLLTVAANVPHGTVLTITATAASGSIGQDIVTVTHQLAAPTINTTTNNAAATRAWGAIANASGYRVYVNGVPRTGTIAATNFNLNGLGLPIGTHTVQVRAIGGTFVYNSPLSAAVTFVVTTPPTVTPDPPIVDNDTDQPPGDNNNNNGNNGQPTTTPDDEPDLEYQPPGEADELLGEENGDEGMPLGAVGIQRFEDVFRDDWFYDYVMAVYNAGVFLGVSATHFAPHYNMTRAMFVQALANLQNADLTLYQDVTPTFNDVSQGAWYFAAVEWAAARGYTLGVGENNFAPAAPVTREQIALMLYRFITIRGDITLELEGEPVRFADHDSISYWAVDAVEAIAGAGLVLGHPDGTFAALDTAIRAQVAAIFARLLAIL